MLWVPTVDSLLSTLNSDNKLDTGVMATDSGNKEVEGARRKKGRGCQGAANAVIQCRMIRLLLLLHEERARLYLASSESEERLAKAWR